MVTQGFFIFSLRNFLLIYCSFISLAFSSEFGGAFPDEGVISKDLLGDYDKNVDYSRWAGRVTDKDSQEGIIKVESETGNIKLLRSGDKVTFQVSHQENLPPCSAWARGVEKKYFVLYVDNLNECWDKKIPFRRGTQINLTSKALYERILFATHYRKILLKKKEGFLKQLSEINNFLYSFNQIHVQRALEFDAKILKLEKEKQRALDNLIGEKEEKIGFQKELIKQLETIDLSLDHYSIQRQEYFSDRWMLDQNLGPPVFNSPPQKESFNKYIPLK
jgi:hypothetical protein